MRKKLKKFLKKLDKAHLDWEIKHLRPFMKFFPAHKPLKKKKYSAREYPL